MRVVSKFLTADVRVVSVRLEGRKVVVEGVVKEMMPMTVEMDVGDAGQMALALVGPLRDRIRRLLPARLRALVPEPPVVPVPVPVTR
jgi:hypothetical protein